MSTRLKKARAAYRKQDVSAMKEAHTDSAISSSMERHVQAGSYVGDFVYGAIDGAVTTFAVVSGVAGAGLSSGIVIVLGFANLFADGFSMAVSNYMGSKSTNEFIQQERKREEWEVDHYPEGERQEIREVFQRKGFKGRALDDAVKTITADKKVWVDTMMREELGLIEEGNSPLRKGAVTFLAFLAVGFVPLVPYVLGFAFDSIAAKAYELSIGLTAMTFFLIGSTKIYITGKNWLTSGLETLFVGGVAASIAYGIGYLLRGVA
jgi:vacuolar iron transporter family protein